MRVNYCIKNEQIELHPLQVNNNPVVPVPLEIKLEKCDYPLSAIHISGDVNERTEVNFKPAKEEIGIVICIQFIKNVHLTEFKTSNCMEMDFCANIVDIRMISANIPFKFCYVNGGTLSRIDIYFPQENVSELLSQSSISILERNGHLRVEKMELMSVAKKIQAILKETDLQLEKESVCCQAIKLLELIPCRYMS